MTVPPPPPGGEPGSRKVPPEPPVAEGSVFQSLYDWYERNSNKRSIFEADYWKTIAGVFVSVVLSATTKITLGWEHKNVLGGTATVIFPWENKFNGGFVLNYIRPVKSETTVGNKSEWIKGWKISYVGGKKSKFQGSNEVLVSLIEEAEKLNKLQQHITAVERAMATAIEQEIKDLEEDHARVERKVQSYTWEYDRLVRDVEKWTEKANVFKADIKDYREECDQVAEKYSGTFKSLAAAAHEINASASIEHTVNGEAKFISDSLVSIGAAITKAG